MHQEAEGLSAANARSRLSAGCALSRMFFD
jgi:hypothetical protein